MTRRCGVVRMMSDTGGTLPTPHSRAPVHVCVEITIIIVKTILLSVILLMVTCSKQETKLYLD